MCEKNIFFPNSYISGIKWLRHQQWVLNWRFLRELRKKVKILEGKSVPPPGVKRTKKFYRVNFLSRLFYILLQFFKHSKAWKWDHIRKGPRFSVRIILTLSLASMSISSESTVIFPKSETVLLFRPYPWKQKMKTAFQPLREILESVHFVMHA